VRKAVLLFIFSLLAILCVAQDLKTFTITPPGEGGFSFVMTKGTESTMPIPIEGKSMEVAAPDDPNGHQVHVIDNAINRAASSDLISILKTKKYSPKSDEFNLIANVEFQFKTISGSLPAGTLTLLTGDKPRTILITASDKNKVTTQFIPENSRSYEFTYEAEGEKKSITGTIADDKDAGPTVVEIEIDAEFGEVNAEAPATGAGEKTEEKAKDVGQNPFMSFLRLIVGLAVVGGLGYGAYYYYKNNQKLVENMANQAGLVPNQNPDPTGALPPEPVKKDLQKIDLGGGSPLSVSMERGPGGEAISPQTFTKNPRLVTAAGDIHLIPEGNQTVGREAASLTLAGESSVSRHHANISRSGDQISVSDAGSTNGTYINGTKIASPTVLNPGDTIQFGAVAYRYEE